MADYDFAVKFATVYHSDQTRKYTGEPYVTHPIAVSNIVRSARHNENMLMAAVLHDVVEDTPATLDDVAVNFGFDVALLVYFLTDISQPDDGNREARKLKDAQHVARGDWQVQTIKVADMLHNTLSISEHDPNFWQVYRHEKRRMLDLLTEADPVLWLRADKILKDRW